MMAGEGNKMDGNIIEGIVGKIRGLDRETVLRNVVYKVAGAGETFGEPEDVPHLGLLDLTVVYKMDICKDGEYSYSLILNNKLCAAFGIGSGELDAAARRNTEAEGFRVMPIEEMIEGAAGMPVAKPVGLGTPMFVLTNSTYSGGSAVLLYSSYFEGLAQRLGSDLYVLPSSTDEVLAVPVNRQDPASLRKIVSEINGSKAMEGKILSGNVYRYGLGTGKLCIA